MSQQPPRLNIIFDERRIEKYEPLINELKTQGILDYTIWPCLMYPNVVKSINLSHKMIVVNAREEGLKEVCIGEDDLGFSHETGWQWFLKNKPKEYDIYLGCTYVVPIEQKQVVGFHLYMVHEKFYDKFLAVPDDVHIDVAMNDICEPKFCYPFPALQRSGWSANNHAICNYNNVLREQDIYKGEQSIHNIP